MYAYVDVGVGEYANIRVDMDSDYGVDGEVAVDGDGYVYVGVGIHGAGVVTRVVAVYDGVDVGIDVYSVVGDVDNGDIHSDVDVYTVDTTYSDVSVDVYVGIAVAVYVTRVCCVYGCASRRLW